MMDIAMEVQSNHPDVTDTSPFVVLGWQVPALVNHTALKLPTTVTPHGADSELSVSSTNVAFGF